jgi:broad specificity phosphatase PhoE
MKVTLVRHGETESNYLDICQGTSNILLNDTGRRQCKKLRDAIKDKHFDVCYTSPLVRTVETAMILIGDRVRMIPEKKLVDRDLGELEGKERSLYDSKKYWNYNLNSSELGVEPVQDIFKRCNEFLDYIKEKHSDESVLVVAHAATIRALKHLILKTDLSKNLLYDDIKNCYYEEIEV